jgi:hypothetical protein
VLAVVLLYAKLALTGLVKALEMFPHVCLAHAAESVTFFVCQGQARNRALLLLLVLVSLVEKAQIDEMSLVWEV